jgi:hypothetical protein
MTKLQAIYKITVSTIVIEICIYPLIPGCFHYISIKEMFSLQVDVSRVVLYL